MDCWTVIRIRTAERDHKAEFYALYDYVTAFPNLKSPEQMRPQRVKTRQRFI